jgi:DNA-binding transcriptional ArsR family regulator
MTRHGKPRSIQWIGRAGQIETLSSPIRQDIVDTVDALGSCSVTELAKVLGRPADGLYYHVKALQRAHLLEVSVAIRGGRRETRLSLEGRQFIRYKPAQATNRAAVLRVVSAMLRNARRHFARGLRAEGAVVGGARRNLWAARTRGGLSRNGLREVNRLLHALLRAFERPKATGSRRDLYEVTFVLAPAHMRRPRARVRS